jgi:membrane protein
MTLDAAPPNIQDDAGRPPDGGRGHIPLWATAVGAALLALGFKLGQYAGARGHADGATATTERSSEPSPERAVDRARAVDATRGRLADTPSQIPLRGWKDIVLRVYHNIGEHRVVALAAGVTFYSILALFPAIAALVALYGLFADPATIANHLDSLSGVLPSGAVQVIGDELRRLTAQRNNTLGLTFAIGLATALWSANAGMKALIDALNLVYNEPEKRGFIKLNAMSLAFTVAAIGFVLLALGAMVVLPIALDYLGIATVADEVIRWARWPALFIAVMFGLSLLYRYGPSRTQARWRWITWGSAIAAILWLLASVLFSWYAGNFGSYNKTYGSLGAVIGFMVWIWISTIVILLGAEIDAEMEHQTVRDTTTGPEKPLGQRGAAVADTVGAAQG